MKYLVLRNGILVKAPDNFEDYLNYAYNPRYVTLVLSDFMSPEDFKAIAFDMDMEVFFDKEITAEHTYIPYRIGYDRGRCGSVTEGEDVVAVLETEAEAVAWVLINN